MHIQHKLTHTHVYDALKNGPRCPPLLCGFGYETTFHFLRLKVRFINKTNHGIYVLCSSPLDIKTLIDMSV